MSYLDDLYKAWTHAQSMQRRSEADDWSQEAKDDWQRRERDAREALEAEQRRLMRPDSKLVW